MPAHARGRRRRRTRRESTAKLQRFDSATHFCENQPTPGSGPQHGNLRDLPAAQHKRNAAVAASARSVSFASTESEAGKVMNSPTTHASHAGQISGQEAQRPKTRKGKWPGTRPRFALRNSARTADQDERNGRLRTSRPKSLEIPPPGMPVVDSNLASSAMRCKDLRRLVDGHIGSWAKSASASAEFPDRLSSGLSKLAAISGSSVRSTACPCDPWTLTSCLTDDENRALASLVAELLVREMKVQQTRPSSAGFSSTATSSYGFQVSGSGDVAVLAAKAAAASLHPRPPPARSFPHLSGPLALPVRKVIPPPLLPTSREVRDGGFRGRSHRFSAGPRVGGGSAGASASASGRPVSASTASLPPNDKFWALLASQGLHPLSDQASVLFQTHLRYATPRVSPNSTVTA